MTNKGQLISFGDYSTSTMFLFIRTEQYWGLQSWYFLFARVRLYHNKWGLNKNEDTTCKICPKTKVYNRHIMVTYNWWRQLFNSLACLRHVQTTEKVLPRAHSAYFEHSTSHSLRSFFFKTIHIIPRVPFDSFSCAKRKGEPKCAKLALWEREPLNDTLKRSQNFSLRWTTSRFYQNRVPKFHKHVITRASNINSAFCRPLQPANYHYHYAQQRLP